MTDERDDLSVSGTGDQSTQGGNAEETQTAGTAGDGGQGGNEEQDELERLRQEKAELERQKGQWLAEKTTADQLKAENERLKQSQQVVDPDRDAYKAAEIRYQQLKAAAEAGDVYAAAILDQAHLNMELRHERMVERQLLAVPAEKRDEVRALYEGGGFKDPAHVWRAMEPAYKASQEKATARGRQNDEAAAQLRQRADTSTRTLGAAETKAKVMTFDEYEQLQDAAERDPNKIALAEQAFRDKEAGRIKLVSRR